MATRLRGGSIEVNLASQTNERHLLADPDTPFYVAVIGDFGGRGHSEVEAGRALNNRRVYHIDRDNFSQVMAHLKVEFNLHVFGKESPPAVVHITDLDDFHPDRLFDALDVFAPFKEIRRALQDPGAVKKPLGTAGGVSKPSPSMPAPGKSGDLLGQIVEATENQSSQSQSRRPADLDEFVKQIVKPHLAPKANPMQAELIAKTDAAIGELMRKILHHPDFQAMEAAWRGLNFLVSRLETNETLKLFLVDITKAELATDLLAAQEITSTGVYELLAKQALETGDGQSWAVLAGNFTFAPTRQDAEVLGRLAKLAQAISSPFIAAAQPGFLGCESLAATPDPDDWLPVTDNEDRRACEALRKVPEASFLGLALPRFLLRLPYGKDTEPVERLDFEEVAATPAHNDYLWGNPCYVCVYLLAQAFTQQGWDCRPGIVQDINGLPLHIYKEHGVSRAKPCAEAILTARAAETILSQGLMPLLSFADQDVLRLARFQSWADPPTALYGRWR